MFQRIKGQIHKYKKWEPLVFFVSGFCFDALLLHRIDDPLMLVHQAFYLSLSASIIAWDLFCEAGKGDVPKWLEKIWTHREGILHFLLGTLLNVYTIFYFKSGSFTGSLSFLLMLALLLFLNEVRPVQISKNILRNTLFGLCLISYMNIVVSIAIGSIGPWVFVLAIGVAGLLHSGFVRFLGSRLDKKKIWKDIRMPFLGIAFVYASLYFLKVLPPVPLSVKHIGIYHEISKSGNTYRLGYNSPKMRFWENGDEHFVAQPGDKIFCFTQIFSPTRFKDQLFVRWKFKDPRWGWTHSDAIALNVVGGREEGYRGYTTKSNYQPGQWRVSVETNDGREVGRISFEVVTAEAGSSPGPMNYDLR